MIESISPVAQAHASAAPGGAWRMPVWAAGLLALASALITAWGTQVWMLREANPGASSQASAHGLPADEQAPIDLAPTAAGAQAPAMLYGMLPLHTGHGLRDERCRQLASEAMKETGITDIDASGESTLFARQGDYALFVGCHLDQKLILVGAAGPVPEQAESLQEQLLRSLQARF